ncbi:MAG: hypothetical protein HW380_1479 [Magnetococcales bacterium]|nr:hypothetical protein [Magnetococcales bacterium]HIJ84827.1 DUF3301 domain-containing protein [Magnetococcales bacterium]
MELTAIGVLLGIGWVWYASMKAREKCHDTARDLCERMGVQLVDDTVSLSHLGIQRNGEGRLVFRRVYEFRYLDAEWILRDGTIILVGYTLESCLVHGQGAYH